MPRSGHRRAYKKVFNLENHFIDVKFFGVADASDSSSQRSQEVVQLVAKMILLSSKRGRPKKMEKEMIHEAA